MAEDVRNFPDRVIRDTLKDPDNLREFLELAAPEVAGGFDYSRMTQLERQFPMEDWRYREGDLLFEIPFRSEPDQVALVFVLVEHQSSSDPRMPLRMLIEVVLYWERQWKTWEETEPPRGELRLSPVLPIVLHTENRPWRGNRDLRSMLAEPSEFHRYVPDWRPLFWELAEHPAEELIANDAAWVKLLAVVRTESASAEEFERALDDALRRYQELRADNRVRLYDLMRAVISWANQRRPKKERPRWKEFSKRRVREKAMAEEVKDLFEEILEERFEELLQERMRETEARVREELHSRTLVEKRDAITRLGRKRFGEPAEESRTALAMIDDIDRLDRVLDRVIDAADWQDLLDTP